jgi:hypothetical protein
MNNFNISSFEYPFYILKNYAGYVRGNHQEGYYAYHIQETTSLSGLI